MSGLLAVVEELLVATIISEKVLLPRKTKMDWALMALSILLGCMGIILSALALNLLLGESYSPGEAALISAAVIFIAALLVTAARYRFCQKKASNVSTARHEIEKNIRNLLEDICGELDGPVRENPKTAVALAALAGFITAQHRT